MILGDQRHTYRQFFFETWNKNNQGLPLSSVERQLMDIIQSHPEYHFIFKEPEKYKNQDFFEELGDTNPFLHMALHLGVIEQLSINLPFGIRELYQKLQKQCSSSQEVEHYIMNALAKELVESQQQHREFSNERYFQLIKQQFNFHE